MSVVFTSTAVNIIRDAMLLVRAIDPSESVDAQESSDILRILNLMIKSWQSKEYLWKLSDVTVTLTPGTQSYLVGPGGAGTLSRVRPLRLKYAVRRLSGVDINIRVISRQEYQDLPQKTQQGPTVDIYYDPQVTNGVLYPWYTGDTSNTTIICTFSDPLDLFDTVNDSPDYPDEWIEAITYNLALRISPMFGKPVPQEVAMVAAESLGRLSSFDAESTSVIVMPERG